MRKNKVFRMLINGVSLAALAALGIAAFQFGTADKDSQEVLPLESISNEREEESPAEMADTTLVKADMEEPLTIQPSQEEMLPSPERELTEASGVDVLAETEGFADMAADLTETAYTGPELNFSENTFMEWPVNGNILVDYSMDQTTYFPTLDQYKLSPAISVQAVDGAPVVSAVNGTVFSIEETAETGTTVTMELGNGYQAVYGQLKDLSVAAGDTVTKGTTIGYVNTPTKYYSKEGSNLYFAMRKDGKPIDPILYLP
ncbi:MAG: M23 family metallopeptidase [Eubacteriales bacterium]|nr:M23 family metallopeptidase [Eubacteriales bacterium]